MKILGFEIPFIPSFSWDKKKKEKASNFYPGQWTDPMIGIGVRGGRMNGEPEVVGTVMPTSMSAVGLGFRMQEVSMKEYRDLYRLSRYNHDVSFAISNIVELANTERTIEFDTSVKPKQAKKMMAELMEMHKVWYNGGEPMLINALLRQLGITGALSAEAKPTKDLKGVGNITLLGPEWVWFSYDIATASYRPYQQNTASVFNNAQISGWNAGYHPLSPKTYKYIPIQVDNDSPYGIPPILAALRAVCIEDDMLDNLSAIVKRLGLFGFLQVVVNAPSRGKKQNGQPEDDETYVARVQEYLQSLEPEIEQGLSNGYVISAKQVDNTGTERKTEFNMTASTNDAGGAAGLMELIMQIKSAGLKQDPIFLGKNFSTTESLAKVLIKKFSGQLMDYQEAIAQFLEHVYTLHLRLRGYKFKWINVTFEPPIMEDTNTRFQGLTTKLNYYIQLRDEGIISQQQFAQFMGFSAPYKQTPPKEQTIAPAISETPAANSDETGLPGGNAGTTQNILEKTESMELNGKSATRYTYYVKQYNKDTLSNLRMASQFVTERLIHILSGMSPGSDTDTLKSIIKEAVLMNWHTAFTVPQISATKKWVEESFKFFRADRAIFKGKRKLPNGLTVPKPLMTTIDSRTIRNFQNVDIATLGAVIFDGKMMEKIMAVVDLAIENGTLPFKGVDEKSFRTAMLRTIEGNSGEVVKITTTTLANIRAVAAIYYLNQAGVSEYELTGESVLLCSNCTPTIGIVTESFDRIIDFIKNNSRHGMMPPASLIAGFEWSPSGAFESCKCKIFAKL